MSEEVRYFEGKMKDSRYRWLLNIFLAIIIFYLAEMSRLVGLHGIPLAISAVWPATGFSLAAILLFGYGMCPGILLGNLCYNFSHLFTHEHFLIPSFLTSLTVSSGSLLEAIIGGYVMRRFAGPYLFSTVKDVFIFLIPASAVGCFAAATIGTAALAVFGKLDWSTTVNLWTAFFIGDLMGVYILTPLIVIWMTSEPMVKLRAYHNEAWLMLLFFLIITYLSFIKDYPFAHFYIPLAMWISYRYRLHGATFAIGIISFVAISFTSMGAGSFINGVSLENRLPLLVSFLEILVAVSLLVSTLTNERESVIHLLEHQNVDLRQTMQLHIEAIKEMSKEVTIKEKLTSLGLVTSNLANYLHVPLNKITNAAKFCLESMEELELLRQQIDKSYYKVLNLYDRISQNLNTICNFGTNADIIATMIQFQTTLSEPKKTKAKAMHLNTLLNISLNQAIHNMKQHSHEFSFVLTRDFDKEIKTFFILPEDLAHVFIKLFENAFHSMKHKMDLDKFGYTPRLHVMSIDHDKFIEIIIQDNGIGMSDESTKNLFQSFLKSSDSEEEIFNIGLSLARDIIVSVYHGEIRAESVKGEYFKHIVTLPKEL
jgi:integral membrane sensor domain MASE1/nitrogen-specific signal transduction histidine kinase